MTAIVTTDRPVELRERPRSARKALAILRTQQILVLPGILVAWHLVGLLGLLEPLVYRSPEQVWAYLVGATLETGELYPHLVATMTAVIIAFVLSTIVGVVAGVTLALMPRTEAVISPYLDAVNAMPRLALVPLFLIYFGIGTEAKVAVAFSLVVFMILANARAGVRSADADILRLAMVMGSTKREMFFKIYLPVAVPSIFAGMRLGLIYSLLAVTASELISARLGLGQLIASYSATYRLEGVYGLLILLAVIATIFNGGMRLAERKILKWKGPEES